MSIPLFWMSLRLGEFQLEGQHRLDRFFQSQDCGSVLEKTLTPLRILMYYDDSKSKCVSNVSSVPPERLLPVCQGLPLLDERRPRATVVNN